ncbi:hypothetical protein E8E95_02190 [Pseudomonas sp. BN414]|uniref:hypothetical protein n=1 Tax=unclassified Pseudomonas TaxID=196821 RepID=UPI002454A2A0|nr:MULTISPECIES: hypothetical protein [unclassified Pseudomonas]MDH4565487.1 hypothetical protein [Pseudomonas sp. BN414]MDH4580813.1 hypothetical protein [Pseudomonas sp. BN415]
MDNETRKKVELAIAWIGPLFIFAYIVFWAIMGNNLPPPNMMGMSGEELVANHYGKYQNMIAVGMIGSAVFGMLYLPWSILLAWMLRDENGSFSLFGYMELGGGILTAWVLAFCPAIWAACAMFAHEMNPEMLKLVHVFTWFIYDTTFMITTVQLTGLGLYVVLVKSQNLFPRWTGWGAIAVGIIFIPLVLIPFVSSGPFAVNGTWNFYIVFGTWLFLFFAPFSYYMIQAVKKGSTLMPVVASSYAH